MNRISKAVLGCVAPLAFVGGAIAGDGVRPADIEAALTAGGWDIIHTASAPDKSVTIGARSQDGWPVIHTLSGCSSDGCSTWLQETPLETGFVESAVSFEMLPSEMTNRIGNSLFAARTDTGGVALRGAVLGTRCESACQSSAIDSFAYATRTTYRSLRGETIASRGHGLWDDRAAHVDAVVPMDHRQIAAIVAATEEAALTKGAVRTPASKTSGGKTSFPPLLPE